MHRNFVIGHKNPDLDSVASSISYAYLKSLHGVEFKPIMCGEPTNEVKYILSELNIEMPAKRNDLFLRVRDIRVNPLTIKSNMTFQEAFDIFFNYHVKSLPVCDENDNFEGIITSEFLANALVRNMYTKELNYLEVSFDKLKASLMPIFSYKKSEIVKGEINLASDLSVEAIQTGIVVVSADSKRLPYLFSSLLDTLIITNASDDSPYRGRAYDFNLFVTNRRTQEVIQLLHFQHSIKNFVKKDVSFLVDEDLIKDVREKVLRKNFVLPVVEDNKVIGVVGKREIYLDNKFNVILVDHNTLSQAIDGIEENNIVEIIDHHNLGDIVTFKPIEVTIRPVGSTSTLIYQKFKECELEVPSQIAKLLLAGILSDTVILSSSTTTQEDIIAAKEISNNFGISYIDFGKKIFESNETITDLPLKKIFEYDIKKLKIGKFDVAISQIQLVNVEKILLRREEIIKEIPAFLEDNFLDIFVFMVTDILNHCSYIFTNRDYIFSQFKENDLIKTPFISRKKDMIPYMSSVLKKYQ
ncbi:MAG: putative manganese-dependent inorganic diphosphatase [Candidatus Woesearchaeota archaeon]